jgi:hypothetical protein
MSAFAGEPTSNRCTLAKTSRWVLGGAQTQSRREDAVPVLIALGFFILITALVIWGSSYMGPDTRANKPH